MGYKRGGKNHKTQSGRVKLDTKAQRSQQDESWAGMKRGSTHNIDEPLMSQRSDVGLLEISEAQIRTYIQVAFIKRFEEPAKEDWPSIITTLSGEVAIHKSTIYNIFLTCMAGKDATKRQVGSGRKRKLRPEDIGLSAATFALNSGLSPSMAVYICNETNKRHKGEGNYETITRPTLLATLKEYTDFELRSVIRTKTGRRDSESSWAIARVQAATMRLRQFELGSLLDAGKITMADCKKEDLPPLFPDGIVYSDQNHHKAVLGGGNGHAGSTGGQQYRISQDPETGAPLLKSKGGVWPQRRHQAKPKFDTEARGCYSVAVPTINGAREPQFLPTFDYTSAKMLSVKQFRISIKKACTHARDAKGVWSRYNSANPFYERFYKHGDEPEENPNAISLDWKKEYARVKSSWYKQLTSHTKMKSFASIQHFVLHLIFHGQELYKDTIRKDTWMISHDALSILWDKSTQEWLNKLACPIDGWADRTWADRFIKIRGSYTDKVANHYKDTLPGDSPELMPLDCHLFSDVKEGVARNVGFSFFIPDDDPDKYSLATPAKVYDAIQRTIASGCPSKKRIQEDVDRIPATLQRIIDAKGAYISDSARHGVREEKRRNSQEEKEEIEMCKSRQDPKVVQKFHDMFDKLRTGKGLPFIIDTTEMPLFAIGDADSDEEEDSQVGNIDSPTQTQNMGSRDEDTNDEESESEEDCYEKDIITDDPSEDSEQESTSCD